MFINDPSIRKVIVEHDWVADIVVATDAGEPSPNGTHSRRPIK